MTFDDCPHAEYEEIGDEREPTFLCSKTGTHCLICNSWAESDKEKECPLILDDKGR